MVGIQNFKSYVEHQVRTTVAFVRVKKANDLSRWRRSWPALPPIESPSEAHIEYEHHIVFKIICNVILTSQTQCTNQKHLFYHVVAENFRQNSLTLKLAH